jgi:type III pantothenate kinase
MMKNSLALGTEALPLGETVHTLGLAIFTEAAIYSGTLMAAIGLIEYVVATQSTTVQLILTGGDAALIAGQLSAASIVDPNLVLRGLLCVLEGHV